MEQAGQGALRQARELLDQGRLDSDTFRRLEWLLMPTPPDRTRLFVPVSTTRAQRQRGAGNVRPEIAALIEPLEKLSRQRAAELLEIGLPSLALQARFRAALLESPRNDSARGSREEWPVVQSMLESFEDRRVIKNVPVAQELGWTAGSYVRIETPHFKILSQGPSKAAAELADLCEETYCAWLQLFVECWCPPGSQVSNAAAPRPSFQIVLFKNRQDYVQKLRSIEPKIEASTGYYSPHRRTSYFYWGDDRSQPTLRHELTHQFFHLLNPGAVDLEQVPAIWAIEGVAMYMESMAVEPGLGMDAIDVGGWDSPRLQAARYRRLHDETWIPWDEFRSGTARQWKHREDLPAWYSQAAGLTHLWMDGPGERRNQFLRYLQSVYAGRTDPSLLESATDQRTLVGQYDQFMMVPPDRVRTRLPYASRNEIALPRTNIDSMALTPWSGPMRRLEWLDLSFTKVDDRLWISPPRSDVRGGNDGSGSGQWDCLRLNLESTAVTDASMETIAKMPRLSELDLSHCKITDAGLAGLRGHRTLKTLWLTGTQVTDESIELLKGLRALEFVQVDQTSITAEAMQRLRRSNARLKR
jgi:hypothetical protein